MFREKNFTFAEILFSISDDLTTPLALPVTEQMPDSKAKHIPVDLSRQRKLITKGFANLLSAVRGIELNDERITQYFHARDKSHFEPVPQ